MSFRGGNLLVLAPLTDEEGREVGPTKLKASPMLLKGQLCMVSVKNYKINRRTITARMKSRFETCKSNCHTMQVEI